jgi:uncharacterized protein
MKRIQEEQLRKTLADSKIMLIQGPSNCGKLELIQGALDAEGFSYEVVNCQKGLNLQSSAQHCTASYLILNDAHLSDSLQEFLELALEGKIEQSIILLCSFRPLIDELLIEALDAQGLLFSIFPTSFYEAAQHFGLTEESKLLEERLIFGNYAEVLSDLEYAELTLRDLVQDVVITHFGPGDRVNKGDKLLRVMCQLSLGIGEPLSYNEIAERVGLDNETVERYIKLLVDAFVVIQLPSYHTEKRYELKKSFCIYFIDNGIRNVLINNLNPTFMRNDMKELWRNYVIAERFKWIKMNGIDTDQFFWRSHTRQQIDLIEVSANGMAAYKTDWEKKGKVKIPELFGSYYPESKASFLNKNTYWAFLSKSKV